MKIPIRISNRHIHLSKDDISALFGTNYELTKKRELSQPNNFAAKETIDLKISNNIIKNIRVIIDEIPRNRTKCEILESDKKALGMMNIPQSIDEELENKTIFEIIGPVGSIQKKSGLIISPKHIHIPPEQVKNLCDKEKIDLKTNIDNWGIIVIKIDENIIPEFHINKDEGIYFKVVDGDMLDISSIFCTQK